MEQGDLPEEKEENVSIVNDEKEQLEPEKKKESPVKYKPPRKYANEEQEDDSGEEYYPEGDSGESSSEFYSSSEEDTITLLKQDFALVRKMNRTVEDENLPKSVSILNGANGSKVYLIGTAHFSKKSCEEVERLVEEVQPDVVILELCNSRAGLLQMNEKTLAEKSVQSAWNRVGANIREKGVMAGVMTVLMSQLSIHITKQLGVAPGGEFRSAFFTSKSVPGCTLMLGDRDIGITLKRAFGKLSFWGKLKFCLNICRDFKMTISKEDVEKLKDKDLIEQLFDELMLEHKELYDVFCRERDVYLAYSIKNAASVMIKLDEDESIPPVILAVVGMGHCKGITENFDREIAIEEMKEICKIPQKSKISGVFLSAIKVSILSAMVYGVYSVGKFGFSYFY